MMSRFIRFVFAAVLLTAFLPLSVSAQDVTQRQEQVCEVAVERKASLERGFAERTDTFARLEEEARQRIAVQREKLKQKIQDSRQAADAKRAEVLQLLTDRHEDKEAAGRYRDAVEQAVAVRRQAYDVAREKFHQQVDALKEQTRSQTASRADRFRSQALNALDAVAAACRSPRADRAAVRRNMVGQLMRARLEYADFRRDAPAISSQIKEFIAERDQAFKEARIAFEAAMQAARQLLL